MSELYAWIPLYKELAKSLLKNKSNRKDLVDWIYQDLSHVTLSTGKSPVDYLHMSDGSKIQDIDPFSVFAIFQRSLSWENQSRVLKRFKEHFDLSSPVPSEFNGIPTIYPQRSFFFSWGQNNRTVIRDQWDLYEKVLNGENIENAYNKVLDNGMPKYSLTMCLYWIDPEKYLALDSKNRAYLAEIGFDKNYEALRYSDYCAIMENVKAAMTADKIPCKSFYELSYMAWKGSTSKSNATTDKTVATKSNEENNLNSNSLGQTKNAQYIDLLKEVRNLVLTGAPGTGKTHLAQQIAKEMGAEIKFVQFHPSYDYTDFVEGLRPVEKDDGQIGFERRDGVFKEFCKEAIKNIEDSLKTVEELETEKSFDWKYYEIIDKIENGEINDFQMKTVGKKVDVVKISNHKNIVLKAPGTSTERTYTVSYDRISKLAKAYPNIASLNAIPNIYHSLRSVIGGCNASLYWAVLREVYRQNDTLKKEAQSKVELKPFVLIIDEINRGEASKIFGELFYAIDPGYRGEKDSMVQTQYQNLVSDTDVFAKGFYVPENVYILATMNDIDRSVESMDFAMRRRFTWKELTPADTDYMLDTLACANEAKAAMTRLNKAITATDGLGSAYQIGPAYFLKLSENSGNFKRLWDMNIEPLLKEYLRGFRKSAETLKTFKEAYFGTNENTEADIAEQTDE